MECAVKGTASLMPAELGARRKDQNIFQYPSHVDVKLCLLELTVARVARRDIRKCVLHAWDDAEC